jgi:hypothetical protein
MNMLYTLLSDENDKLKKDRNELLEYLNVVQVSLSHLLQDGDIMESGLTSAKNLLQYTEELQNKYRGYKNEKY